MTQTFTAISRRRVLSGAAGVAAAGVVASAPASAQSADFDGWFESTSNYDGTVDRRGEETVTITVGAEGNGGSFAFAPAAVQVDPGTTLVWEWTGDGGYHNVAADDGRFESDLTDEAGFTFERTMTEAGVHKYACTPHEQMGMRGAVVVGDGEAAASGSDAGEILAIGGGVGMIGVLFALFLAGLRGTAPEQQNRPRRA